MLKWRSVNLPKHRMIVTGKTGEREIHLTRSRRRS
jgi:hypothetical protein